MLGCIGCIFKNINYLTFSAVNDIAVTKDATKILSVSQGRFYLSV